MGNFCCGAPKPKFQEPVLPDENIYSLSGFHKKYYKPNDQADYYKMYDDDDDDLFEVDIHSDLTELDVT